MTGALAKSSTRDIGSVGEAVAVKYLQTGGYTILATNWTCRYGELDIITKDGTCLVFVEVKYVQDDSFCDAVDLFSQRKKRNLIRTIQRFLLEKRANGVMWRLDLICVTKDEGKIWIEQYKNVLAF